MRLAIHSIPKIGARRTSFVTAAFWMTISALSLFFVAMNTAGAAGAAGSAATSQKKAAERTIEWGSQRPDGLMPCVRKSNDSTASADLKKIPPGNKSGNHVITIHNCEGNNTLTIIRTDRQCMWGFGPYQITLPPNQQYQFTMEDSNNYTYGCDGADKWVAWSVTASNGAVSGFRWIHSKSPGRWSSQIEDNDTGASGKVQEATCDGQVCLNTWVPADSGTPQVTVYFQ
ncbi:hypothetical protein [Pandoraea pulmonicola]|uniref:Uncharacterized protein n=2 Tax=Pandoraea pulmonicola TaxID=93221 RepID=A0AAJ4ZFP0_PANPU|nr:hypothetical protein [Pandoraea pulmonicola]SUA92371.1 Uncharacterised protein [Pandoraea pulmonicola]